MGVLRARFQDARDRREQLVQVIWLSDERAGPLLVGILEMGRRVVPAQIDDGNFTTPAPPSPQEREGF